MYVFFSLQVFFAYGSTVKINNRDVSGKNRILHQRQCEGAPHTRTGMARDDADAPGATSFSVTLGDARVVATDVPAALRTRHFERARGNGHATRTPSQVAATSTPDGVGLLAYVVGGDVEVTRIRGTDGAPSDAARLRLSSAFDDADDDDGDDDQSPDFSGAHLGWCAHGVDEPNVAVLVATCAAGNVHVVDIIALGSNDDDGIAIAGLTHVQMPHSAVALCPSPYPLLATSTPTEIVVLDLRLRRKGQDRMRLEPFATVRHEQRDVCGAHRQLAWLTMTPTSDEYAGPMYAVATCASDASTSSTTDDSGTFARVDVYAWHEETVRRTLPPDLPRTLDAQRTIRVPLGRPGKNKAVGEIRALASSGRDVLYVTADAAMPSLSSGSVVNAAFADVAYTGPADISVSVSGRGGHEDDGMVHIRAPSGNERENAFPKSLVFAELHNRSPVPSGLDAAYGSSSSMAEPATATVCAIEFGARYTNGFVARCVDLPRGFGRPDVLVPPRGSVNNGGGKNGKSAAVLVGSTAGAPRFAAIDAATFDRADECELALGGDVDGGHVVRLRGACYGWDGCGFGGAALSVAADKSVGSFVSSTFTSTNAAVTVSTFRVESTHNPTASTTLAPTPVNAAPEQPKKASHTPNGTEAPKQLSPDAIRALVAAGATPGNLLEALASVDVNDADATDAGESPARAPPRPYPAFEPRAKTERKAEPEAEAEVATAGAAKRATAAARSKLNDGHDVGMDGIKASLSALMTGMNALSRGVDMRMDRIEATLQAQERRLRKIEAAVTKN